MNVVFLDYDGVVNIAMWNADGTGCRYNFPDDNKVNHFQAVQWVSELCKKLNYDIVVTSTWRMDANYKECLINGGLRDGIKILGKTPVLNTGTRCDEIKKYLELHPDIENYLIIDDDCILDEELKEHLVVCESDVGFNLGCYLAACRIHKHFQKTRSAQEE